MKEFAPFSWLKGFGSPQIDDPMTVFIYQRLFMLGAKSVFVDNFLEQDASGHVWENELGVQQLEPLETNPTLAIHSLNEFRFPDSVKYIPKVRASAIEDVPSPSRKNDKEKWGEVLQEAWKVFSLFFPNYAENILGTVIGNTTQSAIKSSSAPWAFASTQNLINSATSQIGFYHSQGGDFAVPTYSGQAWKNSKMDDRIELMKQADFEYTRIPYDDAPAIGEIMEGCAFASWGWGKLRN